MVPFTISTHHHHLLLLLYQCGLHLFMQSSVVKIRLRLWQVIQRVLHFCTSVTQLFSLSEIFFFMCVGKNTTMTGELKKSGLEALERPGGEIGDGASEIKDPEVIIMDLDDERDSSAIDWDEEDDDEARLSEGESDDDEDREMEEEDSEWSDEDEEGDSEASAESLELWESFLNSGDPYNPLSFCSSTGSRTNTEQCSQIKTQPDTRPEECEPKPKERGAKVCFSDQVTVRPLLAWGFASRAARDGSCWMQMARDRERFRRRAEGVETLLKPCLTAEHRAGVWETLQR
ncbi:protein phosphatase 1 regulatory subunit 15A [Carassius gibelio]|uniref:protein phosphatase 1 regulatory subunit 15A n=1 Tax=Carassius gibelio TaxID=101364 RepID=UPI0022786983|nr:protein phosphatase 1 regulatory subunit 15A [Carassius gibelio]